MKKILLIIIAVLLVGAGGIVAVTQLAKPRPPEPYTHNPGAYFVTDVKGSSSLLKTDIMIEVGDIKMKGNLETNNHIIRNEIIFILRSLTVEELKADGVEETLNRLITEKLNDTFATENFLKIYFNEFVIQ